MSDTSVPSGALMPGCWQIALGGQKHRSRLSRLQEGMAVWDQDLAFVATLPLRNRAVKLKMLLTDSNKRRGRLVAHAYIPLADLLPQTSEVPLAQHQRAEGAGLVLSRPSELPFAGRFAERRVTDPVIIFIPIIIISSLPIDDSGGSNGLSVCHGADFTSMASWRRRCLLVSCMLCKCS